MYEENDILVNAIFYNYKVGKIKFDYRYNIVIFFIDNENDLKAIKDAKNAKEAIMNELIEIDELRPPKEQKSDFGIIHIFVHSEDQYKNGSFVDGINKTIYKSIQDINLSKIHRNIKEKDETTFNKVKDIILNKNNVGRRLVEKKLSKMQENVLNTDKEKFGVKGFPGTGKTFVLCKMLLNNLNTSKNILVLVYNHVMVGYIKEELLNIAEKGKKIPGYEYDNFHGWIRRIYLSCMYEIQEEEKKEEGILPKEKDNSLKEYYNLSEWLDWGTLKETEDYYNFPYTNKELQEKIKKIIGEYDLILVDECQDFREEWINFICSMLKESGRIIFFGDNDQNIFRINEKTMEERIKLETWIPLKDSYRMPSKITRFVDEYIKKFLNTEIVAYVTKEKQSNIFFSDVTFLKSDFKFKYIENIINEIKELKDKDRDLNNKIVISTYNNELLLRLEENARKNGINTYSSELILEHYHVFYKDFYNTYESLCKDDAKIDCNNPLDCYKMYKFFTKEYKKLSKDIKSTLLATQKIKRNKRRQFYSKYVNNDEIEYYFISNKSIKGLDIDTLVVILDEKIEYKEMYSVISRCSNSLILVNASLDVYLTEENQYSKIINFIEDKIGDKTIKRIQPEKNEEQIINIANFLRN